MCSGIVWAWLGDWLFSEQRGVWESTGACNDIEAGKSIGSIGKGYFEYGQESENFGAS